MLEKPANEGFHPLVVNQADDGPAGGLQSGGRELDRPYGTVQETYLDFSEVPLAELPGQPLEAHHGSRLRGPQRAHQRVQCSGLTAAGRCTKVAATDRGEPGAPG